MKKWWESGGCTKQCANFLATFTGQDGNQWKGLWTKILKIATLTKNDERRTRYGWKITKARGGCCRNFGSSATRQGLGSAAVYFDDMGSPPIRRVSAVGHRRWVNGEVLRRDKGRKKKGRRRRRKRWRWWLVGCHVVATGKVWRRRERA